MDSFDETLVGLLIEKEGPIETLKEGWSLRWARYAFESGRASARKRMKTIDTKLALAAAELPENPLGLPIIPDPNDPTETELEALTSADQAG